MAQPFEQVLEQIRNTTDVMAQSLAAITQNTQQTAAGVLLQQQQATEKTRDLADAVAETQQTPQESAGAGMAQVADILRDIRNCACECQCNDDGDNPLDIFNNVTKFLPQGKQQGGYIHKAPAQAFAQGGGVFKVPGHSHR